MQREKGEGWYSGGSQPLKDVCGEALLFERALMTPYFVRSMGVAPLIHLLVKKKSALRKQMHSEQHEYT